MERDITPNDYSYMAALEKFVVRSVNNALNANCTAVYFTHSCLKKAVPEMPEYSGETAVAHILEVVFQGTWHVVPDVNSMVGFSIQLLASKPNVFYATNFD